jgi:hypothetical protein
MNFENACMAREGLAAAVSMNRGQPRGPRDDPGGCRRAGGHVGLPGETGALLAHDRDDLAVAACMADGPD